MTNTQNTPTMEELFKQIEKEVYDNNVIKRVMADREVKTYANKLHKLTGSEEKARVYLNNMLIQRGKLTDDKKVSVVNFKKLLGKKVNNGGKQQESNKEKNVA